MEISTLNALDSNAQDGITSAGIAPNAQGGGERPAEYKSFEDCYQQSKAEVERAEGITQEVEEPVTPATESPKPAEAAEGKAAEPAPADAEPPAKGDFNYQDAYENSKPLMDAVMRASQGDVEAQRILAHHMGIQIGSQGQQEQVTPTPAGAQAEPTADPEAITELMESFTPETFASAVESILEKKFGAFREEYDSKYDMAMAPHREQAAQRAYDGFMEAHPEAKDPNVQNAMEQYVRAGYPLEDAFKIANYGNAVKTAEGNVRTVQAKQVEDAKKANKVLRQSGAGKTVTPPPKFKDFGEAYKWTKANMGK